MFLSGQHRFHANLMNLKRRVTRGKVRKSVLTIECSWQTGVRRSIHYDRRKHRNRTKRTKSNIVELQKQAGDLVHAIASGERRGVWGSKPPLYELT
jgi:hypothetical protein